MLFAKSDLFMTNPERALAICFNHASDSNRDVSVVRGKADVCEDRFGAAPTPLMSINNERRRRLVALLNYLRRASAPMQNETPI